MIAKIADTLGHFGILLMFIGAIIMIWVGFVIGIKIIGTGFFTFIFSFFILGIDEK